MDGVVVDVGKFKGGRFDGKFSGGKFIDSGGRFRPVRVLFDTVCLVLSPVAPTGMSVVAVEPMGFVSSVFGRLSGGKPGIVGRFRFNSGKFNPVGFPKLAIFCKPGVTCKFA